VFDLVHLRKIDFLCQITFGLLCLPHFALLNARDHVPVQSACGSLGEI
jgi:hypothetical protein